ncbi:MAG: ABC transporter permease [Marinilabiliaceae bacterium]|nr:ABC transporter permease [Marinilabiliaceae bacterium]
MIEKKITVIKPKAGLLDIDFKELIRYKDLIYMFVRRDIVTQYKQTILGPIWWFVNPILTTLIYMVVFGGIAKISTDGLPQPLFYLSGICLWNYFSTCLNQTSGTFTANEYIFGKVYFPRLIMPITNVISGLIKTAIQLILFLAIYFFYIFQGADIQPNIYILLFPLLIIMLAGLGLGFGIIATSMTTKYRDLSILLSFIVQLWMYATPIIYPLSLLSPKMQTIAILNPITSIIETFKFATLGQGTFNWTHLGYSFGFMFVVLFLGIVLFNKVQRNFMDTV